MQQQKRQSVSSVAPHLRHSSGSRPQVFEHQLLSLGQDPSPSWELEQKLSDVTAVQQASPLSKQETNSKARQRLVCSRSSSVFLAFLGHARSLCRTLMSWMIFVCSQRWQKGAGHANLYQHFQLTLATHHAIAARDGHELTLGFILDHLDAPRSALWRVLTWRVIVGKPDEQIQLLSEKERTLAHLMTHFAVGAPKAERYYEAGLRTTEDLASSEMVEKCVRLGAQHHSDLLQFVPLSECQEWGEHIGKAVSSMKAGLRWELVDGPRRGDLLTKDLYVVAWHPGVDESIEAGSEAGSLLPSLMAELEKEGLVVDQLATGPKICKALVRVPAGDDGIVKPVRRLEINFTINPGVTLFAQTGNAPFLQAVRQRAKAMGYTLDELGLWPLTGRPRGAAADENLLFATTERQVFEHLGLSYLNPKQRSKVDYEAWLQAQPMPATSKPTKSSKKPKISSA